ncbi:MAG: sigma-70 family RNA polymerase sigma factor [Proteobacteria bacterium]|nr:sigma-70 family RNA polymerase sigma factor [Pseudomonadota bacterium]
MSAACNDAATEAEWLARFHAGDREVLAACYRDHYRTVEQSCGTILGGADRETVIHEVFLALLSQQTVRASFKGGSLGAWLRTLGRHRAIDFQRRHRREGPLPEAGSEPVAVDGDPFREAERSEAERLIDRFRREQLPAKWAAVFEARFIRQLSQRDAARALGMHRTTLAYQEQRLRWLLQRFLLGGAER